MEKSQLTENVKEWMLLDNHLIRIQGEIREIKKKKNEITGKLVEFMRTNNIDSFDISDNSLLYKKNTTRQPLNKKTLSLLLQQFYELTGNTSNPEEAVNHLLENRKTKITETVKRKPI